MPRTATQPDPHTMTRPIQALIHSAALQHNYQLTRQLAPASKTFAVVKANAYGHGLQRAAQALYNADGFGILEFDRAVALRDWGYAQPILLLEGVFSQAELIAAAQHDFSVAIHQPMHLQWLENAKLARPLNIFLKLNTGMNRLGFPAAQAREIAARLQRCANVASVTVMQHFATADEPEKGIAKQMASFNAATQGLDLPQSLANSAATFAWPETHRQWNRPGIVLYGSSPFAQRSAHDLGLRAAMTLQSELIAIQQLQPGDQVGYGATFTADRAMRIGVVACGYADGYPRVAPTGTPLVVDGVATRLVGRVSMDMLTVDLTAVPDAHIGSKVELWGQHQPIDAVATAAGTLGYELMCAVTTRVPFVDA
ncbi:Alanine racemase, catabolic [Amantichitinum ursilacus]|uniref:Alanine racemase n=2 Tax=Amantichitinum ursilacus TaxID=857265 RepID=A0A0N0XJU4_9NEIS|nr:Alanine racemase, catabolic [Amantichitinum ursilacus]